MNHRKKKKIWMLTLTSPRGARDTRVSNEKEKEQIWKSLLSLVFQDKKTILPTER